MSLLLPQRRRQAMTEKKNYKIVYTIVDRKSDGKKFWMRLGAAFENQDGSWNVHLDAVPTNGQLQIRDPRPDDEAAAGGQRRFAPQNSFGAPLLG